LFIDDARHDAAQRAIAAAGDRGVTPRRPRADPRRIQQHIMSVLSIGLLYGASTLLVMFSGMPIAFALGAVATLFMIAFMPAASVDTITQNVYEEMASITGRTVCRLCRLEVPARIPAGRAAVCAIRN